MFAISSVQFILITFNPARSSKTLQCVCLWEGVQRWLATRHLLRTCNKPLTVPTVVRQLRGAFVCTLPTVHLYPVTAQSNSARRGRRHWGCIHASVPFAFLPTSGNTLCMRQQRACLCVTCTSWLVQLVYADRSDQIYISATSLRAADLSCAFKKCARARSGTMRLCWQRVLCRETTG